MANFDPRLIRDIDVGFEVPAGLPLEFFARAVVDELITISETAHPQIREQAEAFKDELLKRVYRQMHRARRSDRRGLAKSIRLQGGADVAAFVETERMND